MTRRGEAYHGVGANYFDWLDGERTVRRLVNKLHTLDLEVQIQDPLTTAAPVNRHDVPAPPLPLAA